MTAGLDAAARAAALRSSPGIRLRRSPRRTDVAAVRALARKTGVFTDAEQAVAAELVSERLRAGRKSGYFFAFADLDGAPVGYAAWGPVPMTAASYDLYWIVVDPAVQRLGLGRRLLELAEAAVRERGGRRLYVETSSRESYARTRRFYRRAGYRRAAVFPDFYADGDHKFVLCKHLDREAF
ncbi:MAG TPA: GNAT family N-acetyltransferase [Gammaproteobacteria bacterium]